MHKLRIFILSRKFPGFSAGILGLSQAGQVQQEDQAISLPLSSFRIAHPGAKVEIIDDKLQVTSLPQKWSYAASVSLYTFRSVEGPLIIKVKARVIAGKMAFGVLNSTQDAFLVEKFAEMAGEIAEIELPVQSMEEASLLIIRSSAENGQISKAVIESVTIHSADNSDLIYKSSTRTRKQEEKIPPVEYSSGFSDVASVLLHHLIVKDYPQIENENITDWKKVNLLRQWAAAHIDFEAEISKVVDAPSSPFHYYSWTAPQVFAFFLDDRGGTWCAGFAHALSTLYRMYGYHAYQVDMGLQRTGMTHVVTIVEIEYEGRKIWTVQDPYFDETLVDSLGNPYPFLDMLEALKNRNHHLIKTRIGSSEPHDMFVAPELVPKLQESYLSWYFYGLPQIPEPVKRMPDGRYKYKVKPKLENLLKHETSGKPIIEWLVGEGYPPSMLYMYLYTFAFYGGHASAADRAALLEKVSSIINE